MKKNENSLNVTRPVKFTVKDDERINIRAKQMGVPASLIIREGTKILLDSYDAEDKLFDEKEMAPPKSNVEVNPPIDETVADNNKESKSTDTNQNDDDSLTLFDSLF